MHGITGGIMSELSGGNFISGFAAGAISSVIASGIQALGTNFSGNGALQDANRNYLSYNKFGTTYMKATMVVAGGFSGGISSSIAGGKFIDGFKQGLITSGLNHVAHLTVNNLEENSRAKTALRKLNIDPKSKPEFSKDAVIDLTVRDENLNQMYKDADYPKISLDPRQAEPGSTISTGITLGQKAFNSYRDLYLTLGHEFIHAYHYASGMMSYWINNFGVDRARYNTERGAYSWLQLYDVPSNVNRWENVFQQRYGHLK